jgi:hypothetical protein
MTQSLTGPKPSAAFFDRPWKETKMRLLAPLALLSVSGCAATLDGLGRDEVDVTLTSAKSAEAFAGCFALALQGDNDIIRLSADHFVVSRKNGYGVNVVRWDFKTAPNGSIAELRSSSPVGEAVDKARTCAGD